MALNQVNLKGIMYAFGTLSDIVDASGTYVVGRKYVVSTNGLWTGDATKIGTAYSETVIKWDATADQITDLQTQLNAEIAAREAADATLTANLATETAARQLADTTETAARIAADAILDTTIQNEATRAASAEGVLTTNLGNEVLDRQFADAALQAEIDALDTAYKSADATLNTNLTAALNAAVEQLKDDRVTSFTGVTYTSNEAITVASLVGSTPKEGTHVFKFNSENVANEATVTGLPSGAADLSITYNDIVRVVVDGGVVTSVVLVDDALKAKLVAIDTAIADLQAATTATAIRSHFSVTGFATYVGGVINVALSSDVDNDIKLSLNDGKPYLKVGATDVIFDKNGVTTTAQVSSVFHDVYSEIKTLNDLLNSITVGAESGTEVINGKVVLGSNLNRNTTIGGAYNLDLMTDRVRMNYQEFACWTSKPDGTRDVPSTTEFVGLWFDLQGGANYVLPN